MTQAHTEQPEPLRLADALEAEHGSEILDDAADMLRRLHARVQELEAAKAKGMFTDYTLEEAIRKAIKDDTRTAGVILSAEPGSRVQLSVWFTYEAPANYAKAVLADYMKEQLQ